MLQLEKKEKSSSGRTDRFLIINQVFLASKINHHHQEDDNDRRLFSFLISMSTKKPASQPASHQTRYNQVLYLASVRPSLDHQIKNLTQLDSTLSS